MVTSTLYEENLRRVASEAMWELHQYRHQHRQGNTYKPEKIRRGLGLLLLIEQASKVESPDGKDVKMKAWDAYRAVRRAFFPERVPYGEVGWKEWNEAVHKAFQQTLSSISMEKVRAARETLENFLKDPESVSEESTENVHRLFFTLTVSMGG